MSDSTQFLKWISKVISATAIGPISGQTLAKISNCSLRDQSLVMTNDSSYDHSTALRSHATHIPLNPLDLLHNPLVFCAQSIRA